MSYTSPIYARHHAVQFYGNDDSLFTTVAGFLSQGLVEEQPAVVIATPSHAAAILDHLKGRLIDVDKAQQLGDLVVLDAEETLSRFMIGDQPDAALFEASIGRLIEGLLKGRSSRALVRAYGEMVDVLWKKGREEAAIQLELLWNRLASRFGFALLCGYAMGNFYKQTDRIEDVCRHHTHVVSSEPPVAARPTRDLQ